MRTVFSMKQLLFLLSLCLAVPLTQSGCTQTTTLEAGGSYTDPVLAKTDQAILDASHTMTAFIEWARTNAAFLAKWPEVARLSGNIEAQQSQWERDAYAARDAYADAVKAYKTAIAAGVVGALPPNRAKVDAAVAVLTSVISQAIAYQQAHKPTSYLAPDGVNTITDHGDGVKSTTLANVVERK